MNTIKRYLKLKCNFQMKRSGFLFCFKLRGFAFYAHRCIWSSSKTHTHTLFLSLTHTHTLSLLLSLTHTHARHSWCRFPELRWNPVFSHGRGRRCQKGWIKAKSLKKEEKIESDKTEKCFFKILIKCVAVVVDNCHFVWNDERRKEQKAITYVWLALCWKVQSIYWLKVHFRVVIFDYFHC